MMLHPTNQVALVASHSSGCSFLYPDQAKQNDDLVLRQQDGLLVVPILGWVLLIVFHLVTRVSVQCSC